MTGCAWVRDGLRATIANAQHAWHLNVMLTIPQHDRPEVEVRVVGLPGAIDHSSATLQGFEQEETDFVREVGETLCTNGQKKYWAATL